MKLKGQVAIVVGGAQGIGTAIALTFAEEGANIALVDIEPIKSELEEACQKIEQKGRKAIAIVCDATDEKQVNKMVEETIQKLGRIDILVNSAGFRGPTVPVQDIDQQEWDKVIDINLKAPFLCCKAVLKQMIKQQSGSIVSIGGTAAKEGLPLRGSLNAAKWGLIGLTQTIAKESGPLGIRANAICPGGVADERLLPTLEARAKTLGVTVKQVEKDFLEKAPLRKWASQEEIARAALFLASSDSSHTTGESLNVSGGEIMY
ncbi:SDR family NAD(P)-dependent oxidoreductase [Chloroflexota bacterium]